MGGCAWGRETPRALDTRARSFPDTLVPLGGKIAPEDAPGAGRRIGVEEDLELRRELLELAEPVGRWVWRESPPAAGGGGWDEGEAVLSSSFFFPKVFFSQLAILARRSGRCTPFARRNAQIS